MRSREGQRGKETVREQHSGTESVACWGGSGQCGQGKEYTEQSEAGRVGVYAQEASFIKRRSWIFLMQNREFWRILSSQNDVLGISS